MKSRIGKPDTQADVDLRKALDTQPPTNFVMVAGAGSGKTTSLIKALAHLSQTRGRELRVRGQQIACITYTDVAVNEIRSDVGDDPLCRVSTIHSFLWSLVQSFQIDIREWILSRLDEKIAKENDRLAKPGTRATSRPKIEATVTRYGLQKEIVAGLDKFTYGTGSDYEHGVLGHSDIIMLVPDLLAQKQLLRDLLAARYPVLFVDESQDTTPNFVSALRTVAETVQHEFCVGFFGDPMQKIYTTGAGSVALDEGWIKIQKPENFRSSQSVLRVVNAIRSEDDGLRQLGGKTTRQEDQVVPLEGTARVFVLPADEHRSARVGQVRAFLGRVNEDPLWLSDHDEADVRMLVVVHRMAAMRLGFPNLYSSLNDNAPDSLKEGLVDGTAWPLRPFISFLLPLATAVRAGDEIEIMNLLRQKGPLSNAKIDGNFMETLKRLHDATLDLNRLFSDPATTIRQLLSLATETTLLAADERMSRHLALPLDPVDELDPEHLPMSAFLACPASELWNYREYIEDLSPFATQQGVKGAEFNRVIVLLDDEEGKGQTLFSYGKYFGITDLSKTDNDNIAEGKDSVIERSRRLFYVCCSRAIQDLAVVMFVADVASAKAAIRAKGFFRPEDILGDAELLA
ncbi:UvrD-helicase domain-containing protein [Phyllobacterium sp. P30BS-XVII]|uniref:UvrD-helicase domain-containing protein n=1 Tax=Phyllobacterium sp. P30BS-XVII TaxID=2587046 RepID=UPI0015F9BE3F|nr:UvrD-helicase domain-containing protein [Phyllobacterium sp. P30BS-XVII]MBA8903184.1 DNA helicase-2/ATP-dependent DNA helicase PcrA [Phyllobacterium sp. P30BS-XVII]